MIEEFRARADASSWSADPTRRSAPRSCAAAATCSSSTRRRRPGRSSCATSRRGAWKAEYRPDEKPDLTTSPMPRFDLLQGRPLSRAHHPVRPRLPVQLRVLRHHRGLRPPAAREERRRRSWPRSRSATASARSRSSSSTTTSSATRSWPRTCCARSPTWSDAHGHPMHFNTEVSLNVAQDDELLELLRAAHFTTVFIGIESPRPASLHETQEDAEPARRPGRAASARSSPTASRCRPA